LSEAYLIGTIIWLYSTTVGVEPVFTGFTGTTLDYLSEGVGLVKTLILFLAVSSKASVPPDPLSTDSSGNFA